MADLYSSEFNIDTSIKDFNYWIKDAPWMRGRSISRTRMGEFECSSRLVIVEWGRLNYIIT